MLLEGHKKNNKTSSTKWKWVKKRSLSWYGNMLPISLHTLIIYMKDKLFHMKNM